MTDMGETMNEAKEAVENFIASYYYGDAPRDVIETDAREFIKYLNEHGIALIRVLD